MKKPVIGVTPSHEPDSSEINVRFSYLDAVAAGGGIPLVFPLKLEQEDILRLASLCDGFLFTGGPDVHPFRFGEDTHEKCGNVSLYRDSLELALLKIAMEQKKPILGICRGIQLINVGLGGDLYQDLPSQYHPDFPIAHHQPFHYTTFSHQVDIVPGTRLSQLADGASSIPVNSMHHQAIRRVAPSLKVSAYSRDHLVEAVELPDYPYLLAVQCHPEFLWQQEKTSRLLFSSLAQACLL